MSTTDAFGFDDASRRCADEVNVHVLAGAHGKWVAIRLSDGGSDGTAYDRKRDAIRHQLHEMQCCYIVVPLIGMQVREAQVFLDTYRHLYDRGVRMSDPDGPELMVPNREENLRGRFARRVRP